MKRFLRIITFLTVIVITNKKVFANNIFEFNEFLNDVETVKSVSEQINTISYIEDLNNLEKENCIIENHETYSLISPVCLLKERNYLTINKSLEYLLKDLNTFYDTYQQDSYYFKYKATQPSFKYTVYEKYLQNKGTIYEKLAILYRTNKNKTIKIDNEVLAKIMFENYSFYSVPTNLSNRGACSLANYQLAISKLNGLEVKPGEVLNLNSLISNDPRSCKGNSTKSFLFYGGSCGASSQLFRLALIMPNITVLERAGHVKRRALYYGSNIMGDDAAMYENSKRFTIRNDFDTSVYFMAYKKGNHIYLVGIIPEKVDDYVEIIKNVNGYESNLYKQVFNKYGTLIGSYQFNSRYSSLHRGKS